MPYNKYAHLLIGPRSEDAVHGACQLAGDVDDALEVADGIADTGHDNRVTPPDHDEGMKNAATPLPGGTPQSAPADTEQLSLLPPVDRASSTARFRLGRVTCERGLRHVAEIREVLARRQQERELGSVHRLPPRHRDAA